jgi:hypothetical protein
LAAKRCAAFALVGPRALVIQENTSFRAENGSPELKHSVESSFPEPIWPSRTATSKTLTKSRRFRRIIGL